MAVIYDHRQISMMINSLNFSYFTFFILKDGDVYSLFEGIPGETKQIGRKSYQNEKNARIAASQIVKQKSVLNDREDKPDWGPLYHPEKKWLENIFNGNQS